MVISRLTTLLEQMSIRAGASLPKLKLRVFTEKDKHMTPNTSGPQRLYLIQVAVITIGPYTLPVPCYLVQMGDGKNILIDSGFSFPVGSASFTMSTG